MSTYISKGDKHFQGGQVVLVAGKLAESTLNWTRCTSVPNNPYNKALTYHHLWEVKMAESDKVVLEYLKQYTKQDNKFYPRNGVCMY